MTPAEEYDIDNSNLLVLIKLVKDGRQSEIDPEELLYFLELAGNYLDCSV